MDMTVEVPELPELTFDEASHIYRLNTFVHRLPVFFMSLIIIGVNLLSVKDKHCLYSKSRKNDPCTAMVVTLPIFGCPAC